MSPHKKDLSEVISVHPLFSGLKPEHLELIAGCASNFKFDAGEAIMREGEPASSFYLLRHGRVAVEVFAPGRGRITIQTLHKGDVLGWSWIVEPYRWHHDARAVELTRGLAFDGACMRKKSAEDPSFGFELFKRFTPLIAQRLERAELQLLDVYGHVVEV